MKSAGVVVQLGALTSPVVWDRAGCIGAWRRSREVHTDDFPVVIIAVLRCMFLIEDGNRTGRAGSVTSHRRCWWPHARSGRRRVPDFWWGRDYGCRCAP
jgi:hypothetical protein